MSQECIFYQGGLNNKCLTLYVGEQQASLTLTCLSTSTSTATPTPTKLSPTSLLFAVHLPPPPTTLLVVAAQKSAVQKICFVLQHNKKPEQTIDGSNRKEKKNKKNELCRISGSSQHGERSRLRFMQNSTWKKNNRLHGVFIFLPLVRVVMSPVQEV